MSAYDDYLKRQAEIAVADQNRQKQARRDAADAQRIRNSAGGGYDFSSFGGNSNAYYNAMKNAGFTWNGNRGSNFSTAEEANRKWDGARDLSHYGSKASGGYKYSPASYGTLSRISGFAPSQAYLDAMSYTQSLLDKINSGRTSYSDKVDEMMAKIEGRDPFSYDFNNDTLFQNMLGSAMAQGQTAMQDTMGQAAALTGGYGSSYATSAGNQAYNQFVQNAYAQLPEYYKLALDAYTREGDEMYRQLGMYSDADDKEYGRLTTAYGLNYQQAQDMYGHEYNNYWDTANYNFNVDKYNADARAKASQENYERYKDSMNYALNVQKANAKSGTGGGDGAGATSADFTKALGLAQDLMGRYSYESDELLEGVSRIAQQFNLSDDQLNTLWSQLRSAGYTADDIAQINAGRVRETNRKTGAMVGYAKKHRKDK